jgi:hypothetical protein
MTEAITAVSGFISVLQCRRRAKSYGTRCFGITVYDLALFLLASDLVPFHHLSSVFLRPRSDSRGQQALSWYKAVTARPVRQDHHAAHYCAAGKGGNTGDQKQP